MGGSGVCSAGRDTVCSAGKRAGSWRPCFVPCKLNWPLVFLGSGLWSTPLWHRCGSSNKLNTRWQFAPRAVWRHVLLFPERGGSLEDSVSMVPARIVPLSDCMCAAEPSRALRAQEAAASAAAGSWTCCCTRVGCSFAVQLVLPLSLVAACCYCPSKLQLHLGGTAPLPALRFWGFGSATADLFAFVTLFLQT